MDELPTTRRRLLGLAGVSAVTAVAGCAGGEDEGADDSADPGTDDDGETPAEDETDEETAEEDDGETTEDDGEREADDDDTDDEAEDEGDESDDGEDGESDDDGGADESDDGDDEPVEDEELTVETEYNSREEYAQPGDSFDDFEDLSAWSIAEGEAEEDRETVFTGSQSVRMHTDEEGGNMVIERDLENEGVDLTDRDLSMAVRTPTPGNIAIELRVVDIYGSSRTLQLRSVSYGGEDPSWFRIAPGVVEESEYPPEMDSLGRLEVRIHHTGEGAEVWVDDIRVHEKPDTGYIVLVWDDGLRGFYEEASPLHDEYGVNAVQSMVRQWTIGAREDVMIRDELLERQEAGDQIVGHGTHVRLTDMDPDELRDALRTDKQFKINAGFEGANFLTFPHNSFNDTVLDIASDYYYAGGFNQAGNTNLTAVYGFDPLVLPRTIGHDVEICKECVDLAAEHNQCTILNFHEFGLDNTVDEEEYEEFLEHIGERDVEVITMDELWRLRREGH